MSNLPLNRIIAFAGPYISLASGAIVDWLFVHLHFLANWHTNQSSITRWLTQALIFGLTVVITWLGQQKWLSGWIAWEQKIQKGIAATPVPDEAKQIKPAPVQQAKP